MTTKVALALSTVLALAAAAQVLAGDWLTTAQASLLATLADAL